MQPITSLTESDRNKPKLTAWMGINLLGVKTINDFTRSGYNDLQFVGAQQFNLIGKATVFVLYRRLLSRLKVIEKSLIPIVPPYLKNL